MKDRFDQLLIVGLIITLGCLSGLLVMAGPSQGHHGPGATEKKMQQEILDQARMDFLEKSYQPVVASRELGAYQEALLKLAEIERELPGEAHGEMLRGDIMLRMGMLDRAVESLAEAVRRNADYVDPASPLNQRALVESLVGQSIPQLRDQLRGQPDNKTLARYLKDAYYLQSRLAGGCE